MVSIGSIHTNAFSMKSLLPLLALFALILAGFTTPVGVQVGDTAPAFALKNVDGQTVSFDSYPDAKGYVVTFTCNTCPYAVLYEDRLIDFHRRYAPRGWPVIAINPNDPAAQPDDTFGKMQAKAEAKGFPFAYLVDEGQQVYPAYGATKTPHIFLVDKAKKVRYIGALDDNTRDPEAVEERYVEKAIEAIEAGREPAVTTTRAIGCSIKTL